MEITNDEYLAVIQSQENRPALNARIDAERSQRHKRSELRNLPERDFRSLRLQHMAQLLDAYGTGHNHRLWISQYDTKESSIRNVIGPKVGYISYDGPMALDAETIQAIAHLASLRKGSLGSYGTWKDDLTYSTLENTVDEMIAVKNIFLENIKTSSPVYDSKFYNETDVSKRSIGKNSITGRDSFSILDYELSCSQLLSRNNSVFHKTIGKFANWWERQNDPNNEKFDPSRLGNQTMEIEGDER